MKKNIRVLIYSITILGFLLMLQSSCKKDGTNPKTNEEANTFTDPRDGQVYNTVEIGTQTWFAENLNYETTNSWWYEGSSTNGDIYGRLYTWDAAITACPSGWHLPSDAEWTALTTFLGGEAIAGGKMKETGYAHWLEPNRGATNSSGFTARGGGQRGAGSGDGSSYLLNNAIFWSLTQSENNPVYAAWLRNVHHDTEYVTRLEYGKLNAYSVRCMKD